MTTDNVTPFQGPTGTPPPTETLETLFGHDAYKLRICAEWRALRARQEENWAREELASGFGHLESGDLDLSPLQQMGSLEQHIAGFEPRTALLACELLRVCTTILARQKEDPECVMAQGPVLEIIRNVLEALRHLDGNTRIGPQTAEPA
jgi:hypothetical protein